MADIKVYNNGELKAITSKAFNIVETKELLGQWMMTFSVPNTDSSRPFIQKGAIYESDGQKFDNVRFTKNSGQNNITTVGAAYHVSRRLRNYIMPLGYSFIGTISAIISDILHNATPLYDDNGKTKARCNYASDEFSAGTCANLGTVSYSVNSNGHVTAYDAIIGMVAVGVETQFDNFVINAPVRWGKVREQQFEFGRDLCDITTDIDENEDTTTYTLDVAVLMRTPNATPDDKFSEGDTITIYDCTTGETITDQRIILYEKHKDDPTQDKLTVGQRKADIFDDINAMQVNIVDVQSGMSGMQDDIDTRIKEGKLYNNVSISHDYGIKCSDTDGNYIVIQDGKITMYTPSNRPTFNIQRVYLDGSGWITYLTFTNENGDETRIYKNPSDGRLRITGNVIPPAFRTSDTDACNRDITIGDEIFSLVNGVMFPQL